MGTLISGATGLIGSELVRRLPGAAVLTRDLQRAQQQLGPRVAHRWEGESGPAPAQAFDQVDAVIHLAGEPVASGRWTADRKRRIRDSRVVGTRNLVAGLAALKTRPGVLVCASAVGFYGDRADEELDETSRGGDDFLGKVCAEWEREAQTASQLGIRVVNVRIGVVLARGGGALARMLTPFKMGAGGRLGSGTQWLPWIHLEDVAGIFLHALQGSSLAGPLNAVSPHPVTNLDFTHALGHALHRPTLFPVPKAMLRMLFGEMSEVLLGSQRVFPHVAERTGYAFKYPELAGALAALL